MKNDYYSPSYLKQISFTNIPSDIHRMGLSKAISSLMIQNGIFFISQVAQMTEYELRQLPEITPVFAEKIKRAFYRNRWRTNQHRAFQSIEQLRSIIEASPRKTDILKISIDDLNLADKTYLAFYLSNIRTIGDLIKLSEFQLLRIKGIGKIRYYGILNSIRETVNFYEQAIAGVSKVMPISPLNASLYTQSNLTFMEVFTTLFNSFKPRDCDIFFEYYLTYRARHGAYTVIADKIDLTRERIRKICEKGLRLLRNPGRINCLTTYLNTVWKEKVKKFVTANKGKVTRLELEQEFAADLPAIYFIQNEILQIEDIWATVL